MRFLTVTWMAMPEDARRPLPRFRTLGTIEFERLDPGAAASLLAQPKRLGLLAYLVLAAPGAGHGREAVVSLFWPEVGRARGRGSLRNALHFLRKHLGMGAIRSRGEGLSVDPEILECDVPIFEARVAARRHEEALDLYGGELLPGLDVGGSPSFATWLTRERTRLRRAAAGAAWALAANDEMRGDWISAADHARRAVSLSGGLEEDVRRLMRLMERAGDRVAALKEYESFAARWERDYGLAPSNETSALAAGIRAGGSAARVVAGDVGSWTRRPATGSHVVGKVAILPFLLAHGGGTYEHLAVGLAREIIASLNRVSGVRVVARTSVDRYRERRPRDLGRIASELEVDTLVDGSLRVLDGRLALVVRLVDARTERPLWGEVYEGDPADVLSLRTRLILDILRALGVNPSKEAMQRLARQPTSDPVAYGLYLEGRARWNRRSRQDVEAAAELFKRALALDPGFAVAQAGLADAYLALLPAAGIRVAEARVRARDAARAALALDPGLGEAHATLGLVCAILDRDRPGAEREFRRAIELSPGYATAHHWYGAFLTYGPRRFEEGAEELELARQLDPLSPIIRDDIALALLNWGRPQEALLEFREILELEPDFWRAHYGLGVTSFLCGDPAGGTTHMERAWQLGAWGGEPQRADMTSGPTRAWRETLLGKLHELEAMPRRSGSHGFEAALVSMLLGRHEEALRWLLVADEEGSLGWVRQYYPAFEALSDRPEFAALLEGTRS